MSYQDVHLLAPTTHLQPGARATLQLSRTAARSYALQQALTERRTGRRTPRPARVPLRERARRLLSRPRPA
ncbi:MAG: hypothetical protein AVDCRST_MAG48-1209 [uncultured Friedmanniella sp.]|uniref:Uncharacterized protein n=1 Tax=uncultured Friedmanniella sp. TaxID=335381 RepID=A0A6J4K919_9ACTN|nr:MAG: hypothetical protein AVDCRST_MAG48-1209 [uncultured Friedmanniella sp.]